MFIKVPKKLENQTPVFNVDNKEFPAHLTPVIKAKFNCLFGLLNMAWGTSDFHKCVNSLTMKSPNDLDQVGFPFEVIKEIYSVHVLHDIKFPDLQKVDKWDLF